jgi:hypothetical protein
MTLCVFVKPAAGDFAEDVGMDSEPDEAIVQR